MRDDTAPELVRSDEPLPPLSGSPGLTQGRYGSAGNLELVCPDPVAGLWVFWFNADPPDGTARPAAGARPGRWSGGLAFGPGARYRRARIAQVDSGPAFLEVLACSDAGVSRLYWSPERGFTDCGVVSPGATAVSAPVQLPDSSVHALVATAGGGLARLSSDAADYPALTWRPAPLERFAGQQVTDVALAGGPDGTSLAGAVVVGGIAFALRLPSGGQAWDAVRMPGRWRAAAPVVSARGTAVLGLSAAGRLQHADAGSPEPPAVIGAGNAWASADVTCSSLDGGRIEVVTADRHGGLWHTRLRPAPAGPPRGVSTDRVVAAVWTAPGTATVHRPLS